MDEFGLIARYFAPLANKPGAFRLRDDAAVIAARPGFDLVVTTDLIAAGTDFFPDDAPAGVAKKALRVNLSDLAAKGATPEYYLLTLALPHVPNEGWLAEFAAGLSEDQRQFGVSLLGGDMSATGGPPSISVTAFGFVPTGRMIRRAGVRQGDAIYVTGSIGDSAGGLAILRREEHHLGAAHRDCLTTRYHVPEPPVLFGARHLGEIASAAIDISDGLIADLGHLARESNVRIDVEAEAIPRSEPLAALWGDGPDAIVRLATAGDDYQVAFAAHPGHEAAIGEAASKTHTRVTRIGSAGGGEGVVLSYGGQPLAVAKPGYRHF